MRINFLPFLSLKKNALLTTPNKLGYEWWWHSLTAINKETNEIKPFFIEYYVINPTLSPTKQLLPKPSYFMLKAGVLGNNPKEYNNFYNLKDVTISSEKMEIKEYNNAFFANETYINGSVKQKDNDFIFLNSNKNKFDDYLEWNLTVNKRLSYDLGYSTSKFFRNANFAQMYWHVGGMKTEYEGVINYNNKIYDVIPNLSHGYQDKNWGTFLTPKWVWLSCNNFHEICNYSDFINRNSDRKNSNLYNKINSSIVIGGSIPVLFNFIKFETLIILFYHRDKIHEFNFTKFWKIRSNKIKRMNIYKDNDYIYYDIIVRNSDIELQITFKSDIKKMVNISYQDINGNIPFSQLLNGHNAIGKIKIIDRLDDEYETIYGDLGACEYGVQN
jgi:hypothetical protein